MVSHSDALSGQALTTPAQAAGGYRADRTVGHEAQHYLVGMDRAATHQPAIAGQGLGGLIVLGAFALLQAEQVVIGDPSVLLRLG